LVIYGVLMILVMVYYADGFAGFYNWARAKVILMFAQGEREAAA
jgi:hypothetical protein